MLRWDATGLTLMATADTKLQMQPEEFCATLPPNAGVTGKSAGISWKGPWLEIGLLEGETVRIQ